ncbi:MAG TPA: adenylate/guanylate cyclase domain-containing protein [Caldilineaceae bacterium]|nr:adenylate/guanylate cyclase domain-containing protein [Caldilineaceae bacterium]
MPAEMRQIVHKKPRTTNALLAKVAALQQKVAELEAEIMLEMSTEHATAVQDSLCAEKEELSLILELTTEHSDAMEDELHHRAEEAVRESERRLRLIVEATPVPVVISRLNTGEIIYANAIAGPLVGLSPKALLGRKITDFYGQPQVQDELLRALEERGGVDHREIDFRTVDGLPLWVDLSLRLLEFNAEPSLLSAWHNITHLKEMNRASSRFVPQEYLAFLDKASIVDINLGDYVTGEMTVMFSDLRGFTTISENMTSRENFDFVNAYLGRVSPPIRQHHGFIIKYLGDGIHAIFPRCADDGVQAGIEKLGQVAEYNEHRRTKNRLPIAIGLGVNTGHLMVGMVGEGHRMQGDAFSDDVNLTARLEGLTKFYHVSFILTAATYQRLADPGRYHIRFLDKVLVKGKQKPLDLYEVYEADPPLMRQLKEETQAEYEEALQLYYNREFAAAQAKLFRVLQRNPRDKVAWQHLVKATQLAETGAPEAWTGVTVMTEK